MLALVAVASCTPTLEVTRAAKPIVEPGTPMRRLAVKAMGSPRLKQTAAESLEKALAGTGRFELVQTSEDGTPAGPVDGVVRVKVEQASAFGPGTSRTSTAGAALPESETRVTVELTFELLRPDGTVLATRRHDSMKSAPSGRVGATESRFLQDATENRLVHDAIDECVRLFVAELAPRERTERFELEAGGALDAPVKLALRGDRAGAQAALEDLVVLHPDDAGAHYDLGVLAEARGDEVAARRHYERAVALMKRPLYEKALEGVNARLSAPR